MQVHVSPAAAMDAPVGAEFPSQLLLAEYIHRSADDFAVACAEVHVARREPSLERARDRLEMVVDRLYSLATIQRLLQPPKTPVINLSNELGDLCHHHAQARFAEQGVFLQLRAGNIEIDAQRGWALLMIVTELLMNTARHAFDSPGGLVKVDIVASNGEVICLVSDDGTGMQRQTGSPGAGFAIVSELARVAGIGLRAHQCRTGTMVEMRLPLIMPA